MATFRKRSGSWQVQVRLKNAKPQTRTFPTRAEAVAWARDIEAQAVRFHSPPDFRELRKTTLGDLLKKYLEIVTVKKRGAYQESHRIQKLMQHPVSATSLGRLSASTMAAFRDERLASVQSPTVRRELVILRHVLETARNEWSVPLSSNPVSSIAIPASSKPRQRRVERAELSTMLKACDGSRSRFLGPMVRLALETAMRRGELLAMKWRDVDWKKRTLRISVTKTDEARIIPLTHLAVRLLHRLSAPEKTEVVFRASPNAVRLAWGRAMRRAGITNLHFHDLRHEAISRFFEAGLNVPEVALISGHKDPRSLLSYTHLRAEDVGLKLDMKQQKARGVRRRFR